MIGDPEQATYGAWFETKREQHSALRQARISSFIAGFVVGGVCMFLIAIFVSLVGCAATHESRGDFPRGDNHYAHRPESASVSFEVEMDTGSPSNRLSGRL